jgi:hypothetical protein
MVSASVLSTYCTSSSRATNWGTRHYVFVDIFI